MDIKITPLDIRHKEFKRGLRGYADSEVDEFLDEVANEYEQLYKAHQELVERAEALDEKVTGYKRIEDALQKTLVTAQTSAEEVKQNATKAAQLVLHEAELKARQLMNAAYTDKQAVEQATAKLRSVEKDFRFKFQQMLAGYLKQAEEASVEPTATGEQTEAQAQLARHADAIRAAIAREGETAAAAPAAVRVESTPAPAAPHAESTPAPAAPRAESTPAPAALADDDPAPSVADAEAAVQDEAPAEASGGSVTAAGGRVILGEGEDLMADVDAGVTENEFKW